MLKRDVIRNALCDAIDWQVSLLDSLGNFDSPAAERSRLLLAAYRKELPKYGISEWPRKLHGETTITIYELLRGDYGKTDEG